jgi:hypothetical protein
VPVECLHLLLIGRKPPFRYREEFQAPAGVRKSPKNEPAGSRVELWEFEDFAGLGVCGGTGAAPFGMTCAVGLAPAREGIQDAVESADENRFDPEHVD